MPWYRFPYRLHLHSTSYESQVEPRSNYFGQHNHIIEFILF